MAVITNQPNNTNPASFNREAKIINFYDAAQDIKKKGSNNLGKDPARKTSVVNLHTVNNKPLILELKHSVHGSELTREEIDQIMQLRKDNIISGDRANEKESREGFLEFLGRLGKENLKAENFERDIANSYMVLTKHDGKVISYRKVVPFEKLEQLGGHFKLITDLYKRNGIPLDQGVFSTGGCVAKGYRGKGISRLMFQELAKLTNRQYCISTVYDENKSSKISQVRIGANEVDSFEINGKKQYLYSLNFDKIKGKQNPKLVVLNQVPDEIAA